MPKKTFPDFVPPMMAESTKAPFDSPDWIFEIKLDGYRAITVFDSAGKPHLWSRNGLPLEAKFPAIANAVMKLKLRSTVLDGEVVALDENGIPRNAGSLLAVATNAGKPAEALQHRNTRGSSARVAG